MPVKSITKESHEHYHAVGCRNADQYQEWCRKNGLPTAKRKSLSDRKREIALFERLKSAEILRGVRRFERHPEEVLRDIAQSPKNCPHHTWSKHPYLDSVAQLFAPIRHRTQVREAFLRLLLHTGRVADMMNTAVVIARYGQSGSANTLLGALCAVAHRHTQWRRPLEEWKPESRNGHRQFAELVRFLFCDWNVPGFLDAAWFAGTTGAATRAQDWFVQVGTGTRSQSLDTPFTLTKRMAHVAMNDVPANCTVEEGWRWAQVIAMGGTERVARAVITTPLGESFVSEPFWETVVRFFVDNPLLDTAQLGPLVDYLSHERNTPHGPDDSPNRLPKGFTMKGRTPAALLARMEAWHHELNRERAGRPIAYKWSPSGIQEYECEEKTAGDARLWRITELTTAKGLSAEGNAMSHCVATYAASCAKGTVSVWSLTASQYVGGDPSRVMTIAVNRNRYVSEERGKRNALPAAKFDGFGPPLSKEEAALLIRGRRVVQEWGKAENLILPHYLNSAAT